MTDPNSLSYCWCFSRNYHSAATAIGKKGRPADRKSTHIREARFGVQVTRKVLPNFHPTSTT
jgi:hypothetical protein